MKCPFCGSKSLKTTNSRPTQSSTQTWRRKECNRCHSAITTYERTDMLWLSIKDSGQNRLSPYKRPVLYKSLITAFDDDEMAAVDFENLIDTIEQKIVSNQKTILTKKELVKNVLETIKPISLRAFMKYLSSHTEFDGKRNLNKLLKADFTG